MQRMTRTDLKTVFNELFVFGINSSLHDLITTIKIIVE
jgi:hypothetical protein